MMDAAEFDAIVSGRRRGMKASLLRGLASLAEPIYRGAVVWRNRRFDRGRSAIARLTVPVISVGNITAGGTGKTPMVEWVCLCLADAGSRVAILSRGYGSGGDSINDEAQLLALNLPDVPHLQDRDRARIGRLAIERHHAEAIVLDDGFQHRRLHRDLDIVLVDASRPFGYRRLLPRGLLREPMGNLGRADVVVMTRADQVSGADLDELRETIARLAPHALTCAAIHAPRSLQDARGNEVPLELGRPRRAAAFCGIGNPDGFRRTIKDLGIELAAYRTFPDHHRYGPDEMEELSRWASTNADIDCVLCTQKDLVKLKVDSLGGVSLRGLRVAMQFVEGESPLRERILSTATLYQSDSKIR